MTKNDFFIAITPYFVFNGKANKINEEFRSLSNQIDSRVEAGEKEEAVLKELLKKYKV